MWATLVFILACSWPALAQTPSVQYTVSLADPARHLVRVTMHVHPLPDL